MAECELCGADDLVEGENTVYIFGDGPFCQKHLVACPDCAGHETVEGPYQPDGFGGETPTVVECPTCHGEGAIPGKKLRRHLGLDK